jgi:hypothetical protein
VQSDVEGHVNKLGEHLGHRNRGLGRFRLGLMHVTSNPPTPDVDTLPLPIHISPLESSYLSVANSSSCIQRTQGDNVHQGYGLDLPE